MVEPRSLIPIGDGPGDDLAPEHYLFLNVLYTYIEDAKKLARSKKSAAVREMEWDVLMNMARHRHTRNICSIVGINHKFFIKQLEGYGKEVLKK